MSIFTLTVSTPSPALDKRYQEVALINRALEIAANKIGSSGGALSSGNIIDAGGVTIGSFNYSANAST